MHKYDSSHREETFVLPTNPKFFAHLCGPDPRVEVNSTLIVFVHGFPELGFSWRYQWSTLSSLGYSLVSPDMRGYGNSWVPKEVKDYSFQEVTRDFIYLLEKLNRKQAIFIGHDFGGSVVWAIARQRPELCLSVIGINTPLMVSPVRPSTLTSLDSASCGHFDYQVYFQTKGDDELNADPERTMRAYFRSQISGDREVDKASMRLGMRTNKCREKGVLFNCPKVIPRDPLWSQEEISVYANHFAKTGFPLNWYRAWDMNWEWDVTDRKIDFPCLMVSAEFDAVLTPEAANEMQQYFSQPLERKQVSCGHWTMIERKTELNAILKEYLVRKFPPLSSKSQL